MSRYRCALCIGFLTALATDLSAQSPQPAAPIKFTVGIRGGLAFPQVGKGADSAYHGDVQVSWQAELGLGVARRMTLGVEVVSNHEPEFAGDCISTCFPSPDYSALSGVLNWAPGSTGSRPALLVSAGAGLYRVHGSFGPKNNEFGVHAAVEIPLVRLSRTAWLSPGLRGDAVPGLPGSGMYVISLNLGLRYWGL